MSTAVQVRRAEPADEFAPSQARWVEISFAVITAGLLASPVPWALAYAFPALALLTAVLVYRRSASAYLSLICWLWFLTPLIRRLVEYRSLGAPGRVMLLAPFLALCVPLLSIVADWHSIATRRTAPILYVLGAILYGAVVGVSQMQFVGVAEALVNWGVPLLAALFIYQQRKAYGLLYRSLERTFLAAVLVTGIYGIVQYLFLPGWDAQWMQNSDLGSIGVAEALQVRVFSTMNAPQVFAAFMMVGLLIALRSTSWVRFFAVPVGFLSLILSMSRAAWLGFLLGAIYLSFSLGKRQRLQLAAIFAVCVVACLTAMQIPEAQDLITARFSSLSSPKTDSSYTARAESFNAIAQQIKDTPFGFGFMPEQDDAGNRTELISEERDNSVIAILLSMGWLGTVAFGLGAGLIAFAIFRPKAASDPAMVALKAALVALGTEAVLNNIFAGPVAFLTWSCVGFCLAGRQLADVRAAVYRAAKPFTAVRA